MRKLLCIMLIFTALTVSGGCGKSADTFTLTPFTCEIQMISDGKITEGFFTYENENSMYVDFAADACLGGVRAEYENGVCRYSCDGVVISTPEELKNIPVYGLFSAVKLLALSDTEMTQEGENLFSLSDNNGKYTYTVDTDSGRLMRINGVQGKIIFRYQQ